MRVTDRPARSTSCVGVFDAPRASNRPIDRRVAGAAAQVAGEADLHLVERRLRAERHRRQDHARRADAALRAAVLDERALQRMTSAQPLDRRHARAVDLRDRHQARIDRRAVDRAPCTRRTRLRRSLPSCRSARSPRAARRADASSDARRRRRVLPFSVKLHVRSATFAAAMIVSGVAGISRTSKPACRSALITAGAGPSIGISPTPFAPNGPCWYGFSSITTSIARRVERRRDDVVGELRVGHRGRRASRRPRAARSRAPARVPPSICPAASIG